MRWGCSTDMSPYDVLRRNLAINKLKGDNYGCCSQGLLGLFATRGMQLLQNSSTTVLLHHYLYL